jgi:hypothetical protein
MRLSGADYLNNLLFVYFYRSHPEKNVDLSSDHAVNNSRYFCFDEAAIVEADDDGGTDLNLLRQYC